MKFLHRHLRHHQPLHHRHHHRHHHRQHHRQHHHRHRHRQHLLRCHDTTHNFWHYIVCIGIIDAACVV